MPRPQLAAELSFSAGILSPRMSMRADSEKYATAAEVMENFIVSPQGGAMLRHGMQFIGEPEDPANAFRIFSFARGGADSDVLFEVGAGKTRYWQEDALMQLPPPGVGNQETDNEYLQGDLDDLQFTNNDRWGVIVGPNHPMTRTTADPNQVINVIELPFSNIPDFRFFDEKSPSGLAGTSVYRVVFSGTWEDNNHWNFYYDGVINSRHFTSIGGGEFESLPRNYRYRQNNSEMENELELAFRESFRLRNAIISADFVSGDEYDVTVTGNFAGRAAEIVPLVPGAQTDIDLGGFANSADEPAWSFPYVVSEDPEAGGATRYYRAKIPHISDAASQPGQIFDSLWPEFWEDLGETPPDWWEYQHGSNNPWASGVNYAPWDRGFPSVAVFHDQRLILAGSRDAPTSFWGSRIGEYDDFTLGPNTNDPFSYSLDTTGTPAIKWMTSNQGLIMGTSAGDFLVTAEITLSPNDINVTKQNNARSALEQSVQINTETFYIEQGRRKIRANEYARQRLALISTDISLLAEHIFYDGIKELTLMHTPEVLLVGVTLTGGLVSMTYVPDQGVGAWVTAKTHGDVIEAQAAFSDVRDEDEIYLCVRHGSLYTLEKMRYPPRNFEGLANLEGIVYLDSYYSDNIVDATVITGIPDRFEGETVGLTINDAFEGEFLVVNNEITIAEGKTGYYSIGWRYTGSIKTFEQVDGNPKGVGFGTARRWNKLYTRVLDSALVKTNGQLPPDRTPSTPMNTPEPLRSTDSRNHNLGFSDGSITIVQDLPFPTHVLGLYGELGIHNA